MYQEMIAEYMNQNEISKRVRSMINSTNIRSNRFNINIDELRAYRPQLATFIMRSPLAAIKMFQEHLNNNAKSMREEGSSKTNNEKLATAQDNFPKKTQVYYVNFEGNFGRNHITPRGLKSDLLNQYVQVSGIVTRMSIVKPRIQTSIHYCESTKRGHVKHYTDTTNLDTLARQQEDDYTQEGTNGFLTSDANGNPLSVEYGYCIYRDYQTIVIQEMPERAPPGQLPRSIEVILEDDLVDKVKPGDRIQVTGVYRAMPTTGIDNRSAITLTKLIATGLVQINFEKEKPNLNENDIKNIKKLSKDEKLFDILGGSIASSIEGMNNCKKALLL